MRMKESDGIDRVRTDREQEEERKKKNWEYLYELDGQLKSGPTARRIE